MVPGVEVRLRLAEGEARELHERALVVVGALADSVSRQLEPAAVVGPQRAVFSLGPDVKGDDRAGPRLIVGRVEAVVTAVRSNVVGVAATASVAEVLVVTHPAADLETGIGARDIEEPFAVETADLHVFDRFGLDGKIGCLCPSNRDQTRRAAEEKAFHHLHRDLQVCVPWEGSVYAGCRHPWKVP